MSQSGISLDEKIIDEGRMRWLLSRNDASERN